VDTGAVRSRFGRDPLDGLDAAAVAAEGALSRSELLRRIVIGWFHAQGYLKA
jgi:hypothetical protein